MTLLWCSSKFHSCINLAYVIKLIFNPSLWNIDNIAPLVVNIYLGLRPREIFLPWVQYLASKRSEQDSIRGVQIQTDAVRIYIYMYGGMCAIIVAHTTYT